MIKNKNVEQYFLLLVVLVLFAFLMIPFVQGLTLGFLIALVVYPFYQGLLRKIGPHRHFAATITTLLLTVCVVLPISLIMIGVIKESIALVQSLRESASTFDIENSLDFLKTYRANFYKFAPFSEGELKTKLQEFLTNAGSYLAGMLASFVTSLPAIGLNIALFLLSFYYALVDGEKWVVWTARCLPFERSEVSDLFSTTDKICRGVVVGSLVSGLAQGLVMAAAYLIFGVPGALLFGALTVLFSFVPILGVGPTGLGAILYLLLNGHKGAALGMLVAMGLASVTDNIVKPLVLAGSVELHPLLGLLSALGGLVFFGFVGLFLGPLIAAFTIVLLDMIAQRNSDTAP